MLRNSVGGAWQAWGSDLVFVPVAFHALSDNHARMLQVHKEGMVSAYCSVRLSCSYHLLSVQAEMLRYTLRIITSEFKLL